jgi:hypothetical protein
MTLLSMWRGDDPVLTVTVRDKDTGDPVDLANVEAVRFTARRRPDDPVALISKTLDDGITADESGVISVPINAADTAGFPVAMLLVWDVEVVGAGRTTTVAFGRLRVRADVSRPPSE